jgi:hypothetical protein
LHRVHINTLLKRKLQEGKRDPKKHMAMEHHQFLDDFLLKPTFLLDFPIFSHDFPLISQKARLVLAAEA